MFFFFLILCAVILAFPYRFRIETRTLSVENLPDSLNGFSVLHISDTHFYGTSRQVERFVRSLSKNTYDLIAVTGDIIEENHGIRQAERAFSPLKARLGKYYVLGNHDSYFYDERYTFSDSGPSDIMLDSPLLKRKMKNAGFSLLYNTSCIVHYNNIPITVAGCGDLKTGECNIQNTLANTNGFTILLSHCPDVIQFPQVLEKCTLILAGHTHGGQIIIPFAGPAVKKSQILPPHKMHGIFRIKKRIVAVSNGVGTSKLFRFRFFCHPRCSVYILKQKGVNDDCSDNCVQT